jgi:hypothetical protein
MIANITVNNVDKIKIERCGIIAFSAQFIADFIVNWMSFCIACKKSKEN